MLAVQTPEWVKYAIFYQIFPDRFAKSSTLDEMKPRNLEPWDTPPTVFGYKGGDLMGVVERLDYIQGLGVNAIYFTPIFQSASNHRYHTHDYYQVDPLLGGNDAFFKLLNEAHRRGIRIVLDGVFNHCSRGFFQFNDILENGKYSPWVDWFEFDPDVPLNAYAATGPLGYKAWRGLPALPKFNTDNPQVREYIMRIAEYWIRQGIDGWRLDVPAEIETPGFWEEFRQRVKSLNPEAYIVGEIWRPAQAFLQGDRFDAVMNYVFAEAAIAYTAGPRVNPVMSEDRSYDPATALDARGYADRIDWLLGLYPWEITLAQMNLLDSHDSARVITLARNDKPSVELATLLLFTFPGAPSIYYGDEIGLPGGLPDYDTRRPFPWHAPETWDQDTLAYHKSLIALRNAHPALRRGSYHRLFVDDAVYSFGRQLGDDRLIVATNVAEEPRTVDIPTLDILPEGATWQVLYGGQGDGRVKGGNILLSLLPRCGVVLGI